MYFFVDRGIDRSDWLNKIYKTLDIQAKMPLSFVDRILKPLLIALFSLSYSLTALTYLPKGIVLEY